MAVLISKKLLFPEEKILSEIFSICQKNKHLSYRSKKEIAKYIKEECIYYAVMDGKWIGFLITVPYSNQIQELAAAYVKEEYRHQQIFTLLVKESLAQKTLSITVTFNCILSNYLQQKYLFSQITLTEVIKLTRGKFLFKRMHPKRLLSIRNHYKQEQPIYLYYQTYA